MSIPIKITDHQSAARARFTDRFKNKKFLGGFMDAFSARAQVLEGMFWDVLVQKCLDNATGDALDQLGKFVGEPRDSRGDVDYKIAVRLRIKVNRSNGRAEDVLQVATIAFAGAPFTYQEIFPLGFYITVFNIVGVRSILRMLGQTRMGASRGVLYYSTWPAANNLYFASRSGGTTLAGKGFSSRSGGTVNTGVFIASQEMVE